MERLKINLSFDIDQTSREKMKSEYLSCPQAVKYINDLKIPEEEIDNNITKIHDFVNDINYCKNCPGIKNCAKENPLLCTKIVYSYGVVERRLVPCKEYLRQITFESQFETIDFPKEWLDNSLKELNRSKPRMEAMEKYTDFIKNFNNNWMFLTGAKNSGRSFLAACLVVDAAKRNRGPVCFLDCSKRLRELSDYSTREKEAFDKKIQQYSNVPILVLDDFGNEFKNDYVRDAILFPILSNRANKRLFTIFTSDFNYSEIETLYSTSKAGSIRAKQIVSLISSLAGKEINLGSLSVY